MIATIAVRAICLPKVGPIDWLEKSCTPNFWSSTRWTFETAAGSSLWTRIWMTCGPSSGSLTDWIFASA